MSKVYKKDEPKRLEKLLSIHLVSKRKLEETRERNEQLMTLAKLTDKKRKLVEDTRRAEWPHSWPYPISSKRWDQMLDKVWEMLENLAESGHEYKSVTWTKMISQCKHEKANFRYCGESCRNQNWVEYISPEIEQAWVDHFNNFDGIHVERYSMPSSSSSSGYMIRWTLNKKE